MSFSRTDSHRPQVAPPVLGPEYSGQESGDGPERLHVPVQQVAADRAEAGVALRRLPDGRLALLVYSSAELLAECCGEHQSWIAILWEGAKDLAGDAVDGAKDKAKDAWNGAKGVFGL
ncbi:SAV_915 family protein [Saccharopolyspora sp. NPDC003752]